MIVKIKKLAILINSFLLSSCTLGSVKSIADNQYTKDLGPNLIINFRQQHTLTEKDAAESGYSDKEPQVIIQPLTSVNCVDAVGGIFSSNHCILSKKEPLPEKIDFRYGVWISKEEENHQFPPISDEIILNAPQHRDFDNDDEWNKAAEAYYKKIYNSTNIKSIEAAKAASINNISWKTYTIYPKKVMKKYEDMNLINAMRASSVYYQLIFNFDSSVTIDERLVYLDPDIPER